MYYEWRKGGVLSAGGGCAPKSQTSNALWGTAAARIDSSLHFCALHISSSSSFLLPLPATATHSSVGVFQQPTDNTSYLLPYISTIACTVGEEKRFITSSS